MHLCFDFRLTVKYDPLFGRHVVANRDIEVGEVLFHEKPIVSCLSRSSKVGISAAGGGNDNLGGVATPACHHCLKYIHSGVVPCPTCDVTLFCRQVHNLSIGKKIFQTFEVKMNVFSVECRNAALSSHHKWECKLSLFLERTQLDRLPLIMMAFRAITQKPANFFDQMAKQGAFQTHDIQNGVELEEQVNVVFSSRIKKLSLLH